MPSSKEALLAAGGAFYTMPHHDGHPTVLIDLGKIGEAELRELVTESWRLRTPARVRKDHPNV